jgi:tetratricopeptide (TPR) repeat protein
LRLALASIHQQISDILAFSGDSAGALDHSGKALTIYEGLSAAGADDTKFQTDLTIQTYRHANLLRATDIDGAAAEYRRAAELSGRLIAAHPSDPEGKIHLATSLDGLGNVLQEKGDTAGALENRRKGLAIREELAATDPNNGHYRRQLAFSHHNVGLSLVEAGDLSSALTHFRRELSLFESLSAADPKDAQARRNRSLAHKQIGDVLMRNADPTGALEQYRKSLDIDRELVAADANAQALLDLSFSEGKWGAALGKLGKTRDALTVLHRGVARQEQLAGQDPHDVMIDGHLANSYTRLANCLFESGDTKAAIEYYRKAAEARLRLAAKRLGGNANLGALAECYTNLGKALTSGDPAGALKQYNQAIELLDRLTAGDKTNAQYRSRLADARANAVRLSALTPVPPPPPTTPRRP